MIATSKAQIAVEKHQLPKLTKAQLNICHSCKTLTPFAKPYAKGKKGYCPWCGAEMDLPADRCPHCNGKLYGEPKKEHYYDKKQFAVFSCTANILDMDYQIIRTYLTYFVCKMGEEMKCYGAEIINRYIREDGVEFIKATERGCMNSGEFSLWGGMWLTKHKDTMYQGYFGESKLDAYTNRSLDMDTTDLIPKLKKYFGFKSYRDIEKECGMFGPVFFIKSILNTTGETIYKTRPDMFSDFVQCRKWWRKYYHCIKICDRRKYQLPNLYDYRDYIEQLDKLGMDTHNPTYVCPEDFEKTHTELTKKLERRRIAEEAKRKAEEMEKERQRLLTQKTLVDGYAKRMLKYMGIVWNTGNVTIVPLMTVEDVLTEGCTQHHCVFQNGYWKQPENLLLTSCTADGEKQETIQIDLRTMAIVQSRGVCNRQTAYHDEIVNYINAHINEFKPQKKRQEYARRHNLSTRGEDWLKCLSLPY